MIGKIKKTGINSMINPCFLLFDDYFTIFNSSIKRLQPAYLSMINRT